MPFAANRQRRPKN